MRGCVGVKKWPIVFISGSYGFWFQREIVVSSVETKLGML